MPTVPTMSNETVTVDGLNAICIRMKVTDTLSGDTRALMLLAQDQARTLGLALLNLAEQK
jgi:hypothetical protein